MILPAILAAALPAGAASASPPVPASVAGFDDTPLTPGARFSAMDLLRRVFPDLDGKGRYRTLLPVKVVDGAIMPEIGAGYRQDPADPPLAMQPPSFAVVREGRHAIGFVLGAGVLVADWLLPAPAVGEAIFVQTMPGSEPMISSAFPIAEGEAAALVVNSHLAAGEGYAGYSLFAQGFSGLRQVYDGPELRSITTSDARCAARMTMQTLSDPRPLATRRDGHADIAMRVNETSECASGEDAKRTSRDISFTLRWDARAGRYRGGSRELSRRE